jgi:DNA-binding CsgD family transcriptional regulator
VSRGTLSDATAAWCAGDFERCLEICEGIRRTDVQTVSEVALLRARALLRLDRPADVERVINDIFVVHGTLDANATAQMLLGAAEVRLDRVDDGLARLTALQGAAVAAHPTIRSEIAVHRALAYFGRRDLDAADAALDLVSPDSDIVYARALEYRGWAQWARGRSEAAAAQFRAALECLADPRRCRRADRFMEANCLQILATLADEMFDHELWSFVERRAKLVDWSAGGLALSRFWIAYHRAGALEMRGRVLEALEAAEAAEDLAPPSNPGYRAWARIRRAKLARDVGEQFSPAAHLRRGAHMVESLDFASLVGEERIVPLVLAEELAESGDGRRARAMMERYRANSVSHGMLVLAGDARLRGAERYAEGSIAEALGEKTEAHHGYRDAFQAFRGVRYTRRAVVAALRLAELNGEDYNYEFIATHTANVSRTFWVRRAIRGRERMYSHPVARNLKPLEREILALLCEGRSNLEIAVSLGRSEQTVKNRVSPILAAFGAESRTEVTAICARAGILGQT